LDLKLPAAAGCNVGDVNVDIQAPVTASIMDPMKDAVMNLKSQWNGVIYGIEDHAICSQSKCG
jgi:hypothetical protein